MRFSELLEEFVTGLIEGPPKDSEWQSIQRNSERRQAYRDRMQELRDGIDQLIKDSTNG